MKKTFFLFLFFIANSSFFISNAFARDGHPDTVTVGIYVTSIHDIDFKAKAYSVNLWLWLKYKRPEFDFIRNLEVPMAKTFEKSYATLDTLKDGTIYILMKLQCLMKGTWKIKNFPFDRQELRFAIENSVYDSKSLVFASDTIGQHYGDYFLTDWVKDSFNIKTEIKKYGTGFGDPALQKPHSEYGTYKATIAIHRDSWELFIKLFLGMYVSFLIACMCFYIHPDNMDSRLALSVGSLFAVIGNKYIIDSALPESNSFTLVDTLHGFTLIYILLVISASVFTLNYIKRGRKKEAELFNKIIGAALLLAYLGFNAWFIYRAYTSTAVG